MILRVQVCRHCGRPIRSCCCIAREISELDYAYAATNGAAYDAVQIAKSVL